MSSNDDSPTSQPHSVQPGFPTTSNKNPKIDTVDTLLRTIFRMDWGDWVLTAILISCLINHYFFTVLNIAQPIIDFTRLITALISVIFIACKVVSGYKSKELITIFFKNHPLQLFILIIACGATAAFFLPLILNISKFIGETDKLTTALLASTGGVIAVFTLIKTHQKNQNDEISLQLDREKYEQQKEDRLKDIEMQDSQMKEQKRQFNKKTKQEAYRSHQERIRQIHAERRSRYTKAVEQLANENAAVRLGGIYTLVGLVDEWLADESLTKDKQREEGQVIINNLCSYIRSPFPLAAKIEEYEARKELEKLQKSESWKLSEEESSWLQILIKRFEDSDEYEKPKDITTDYAKFHEEQDVRRTIFVEMSKRSSTFTKNDKGEIIETVPEIWSDFNFDFSRAPIFYPLSSLTIEKGNFSSAKFYSNADFGGVKFTRTANFSQATFTQTADFRVTKFFQTANFSQATFTQTADFSQATFTQTADFSEAAFTQTANFRWATFTQTANFSQATFTQTADFSLATFTQTVNFSEATFSASSPKFVETVEVKYVEISKVLELAFRARFATLPKKQQAHNFAVHEDSQPIHRGEAELDGVKYRIPVGTVLFDPRSGETSEPAKPLDKSNDSEEEKPAE